MSVRFVKTMFTSAVKAAQTRMGSRGAYEIMEEEPGAGAGDRLSQTERDFIVRRDSFYMATVSETGWPYVQHRGGPAGFLKVLGDTTLGFADYKGNRQYISVGNIDRDDRVSLFLMDYPNRRRLKLIGRARAVGPQEDPDLMARLRDTYEARVERGMVIEVEGFDWNCPQHITPRFTEAEVQESVAPLMARLRTAEARAGDLPDRIGNGPLQLAITGVRQLTPRVRAYELKSPDRQLLPAVEAGAHLLVPVRLADGTLESRSYSIISDPARRDLYEIAVRRDDEGRGGSAAVHRDYRLGLRLNCGGPANGFELHDDARPSLLIAGGIGVTPIYAMARTLKARGADYTLHYAARSAEEAALRDELALLAGERARFAFRPDRLDVGDLLRGAAPDAVVYVCGPESLLADALSAAAALGWPPGRLRVERFAAAGPVDGDQPFDLVLARSGERVTVAADETALEALERHGHDLPFSCRTGTCGTCVIRIRKGDPDHRDDVLSDKDRARGEFALCVSRARSPELVVEL